MDLTDSEQNIKKFISSIEEAIINKMDANRHKIEKLEEMMKRHEDNDSSLQVQSAGVRASIVAAPVFAVPASVNNGTNNSEPRSPSPSSKKRTGVSQEQL